MMRELLGSRILVPLDGSELAERALPAAERVAVATRSTLLLVRIIPLTTWAFAAPDNLVPGAPYQELIEAEEREAYTYLQHVAEHRRDKNLRMELEVQRGDAAATLIDIEQRFQVGLVVMTTHGRTGMARFALGSVADRLVRGGSAPVLLVRPFVEESRCQHLERAIVPLDGSPLAELSLGLVRQLAGRLIHHVTLLRAVSRRGERDEVSAARRYLEEVRLRLERQLVAEPCTLSIAVVQGEPAEQIIRQVATGCDLVVMTTHGETGTRRWAMGSVADRVLHDADAPLLLVHPPVE
jgi:nucleotide-binding universal stress UspA family protein